ncbi:MAG: Flagellar-associated PapD-like [bacterium]|nr:Flagellar-associated PapD-like [bacterium]
MKKKILMLLVLLILGMAFPFADESFGLPFSSVVVEPDYIDFGDVRIGSRQSVSILIINYSSIPLRVHVNPSSPFISVERTNFTIPPHSRTSIRVIFRATATFPGLKSDTIVINTNRGVYRVHWRARVVPPYGGGGMPPFPVPRNNQGVSETYIELRDFSPGEIRREITLFNPFPYPIRVRVEPRVSWVRVSRSYVVIPPFGSYPFPIFVYIDDFPSDTIDGIVTFYFPWGAVDVRIVVRRPPGWYHPGNAISVAPNRIDFGRVFHGEVREKVFRVRNNTPTLVKVSILDTAPWLRVYPYEAFIPPRDSRTFRVRINGSLLPSGVRRANVWIDTPYGRFRIVVRARGGF